MKNQLCLLSLSCSVLFACGASNPSDSMDQRARNAIPTADTVAMKPPTASVAASRSAHPDSSVGDASVFLGDTVHLATVVNGAIVSTLHLIKSITDLPATSCTTTSCTWGPGALATDPVSWQLVVTESAGTFDYTLSGQAKVGGDGQMHPIIIGSATPSVLPHRGSGSFSFDFSEAKVLNPMNTQVGKLDVTYSNATVGAATIDATFLGTLDEAHPPQTDNAAYAYAEDGHLGGTLQIAVRNLTSGDLVSLESRWASTGAGRSDVSVTVHDGSGGHYSATESECWANATSTSPLPYHVVFFTSSDPAHLGADSGSASDCAFPTAQQTSLTAP